MNIYGITKNNPINSFDRFGLKVWTVDDTFSINQLSEGTEVGRGGHAWPKTWESECGCEKNADGQYYELKIKNLKAVVEVVIRPNSGTSAHEAKHVEDYRSAWTYLVEIANEHEGSTYCSKIKCDCYCELINKGRLLLQAWGIYLGALLHVNGGDYDGITIPPTATNPESLYYILAQRELASALERWNQRREQYRIHKQFCDQLEESP